MLKVAILAGGRGTRLAEETELRPKPLVEIGGRPILWHIMKHFAHHGHKDFLVALGYKGELIKKYFVDYATLQGNLRIVTASGDVSRSECVDDWNLNLIDTGNESMTGGRILHLRPWLERETFLVTYGDGVSDVDLDRLVQFHRAQGKIATLTAVRPPARFGSLVFDGDGITRFAEKAQTEEGWINGGYLVFEPEVFDYLQSPQDSLEADVLERLASEGQLAGYRHAGFWQCMDTLREKQLLNRLWESGTADWNVWSDPLRAAGEPAGSRARAA
ncbi:MAG: glucose-1-phosphate cytidylyltransferase [Planctomycetales bacterium]